jgi:hypothetical protein
VVAEHGDQVELALDRAGLQLANAAQALAHRDALADCRPATP